MLRSTVIACGLADRIGLSKEQRETVFYTSLLMWIGCHADSQEYADWFGDDIAVRRESYLVDSAGLPFMRFVLGNVARGETLPQRAEDDGGAAPRCARSALDDDPLALHVGGRAGQAHWSGLRGRADAPVHLRAVRR